MTMGPETWERLAELGEQLLRLSDEALRAARQQDADVFWRCMERQQAITREALTIRAALMQRRR